MQLQQILDYEPTKANIEKGTADWWQWQVYGLGIRARQPGAIFESWRIVEDWPERMHCMKHGYGLDFGFAQFNTALIECGIFQDQLWLRQRVYEKGLINTPNPHDDSIPSLVGRMKDLGLTARDKIDADSSRKDLIKELRLYGYNVVPVSKSRGVSGDNHLLASIQKMKSLYINVHMGSDDLQTEFENYVWQKDPKTDEPIDEPIDEFNDGIDSARMWVWMNYKPSHYTAKPIDNRIPQRRQSYDVFDPLKNKSTMTTSNVEPWNQSLQEIVRGLTK
jgi:hypothetical protein